MNVSLSQGLPDACHSSRCQPVMLIPDLDCVFGRGHEAGSGLRLIDKLTGSDGTRLLNVLALGLGYIFSSKDAL